MSRRLPVPEGMTQEQWQQWLRRELGRREGAELDAIRIYLAVPEDSPRVEQQAEQLVARTAKAVEDCRRVLEAVLEQARGARR